MVKQNDRIVRNYWRSKRPDKLLVYGISLDDNNRVIASADELLEKLPKERTIPLLEKLLLCTKPAYHAPSIRYAAAHRLKKLSYSDGKPQYAARFYAYTGDIQKASTYGKHAYEPIAEAVFSKSGDHSAHISSLIAIDNARAERDSTAFLATSGYVYQFEKLFEAVKSDKNLAHIMKTSDFWQIKTEAFSRMSDKGPCIEYALTDSVFDLRKYALVWLSEHNQGRIAKRWKEAVRAGESEGVLAQILFYLSDTRILESVLAEPSAPRIVRLAAIKRLLALDAVPDQAQRDRLQSEADAFDAVREQESAERRRTEDERSESLTEAYRNMEENFK